MGTPDFAATVLKSIASFGFNIICAVSQPDKPQGRHHRMTPTPVRLAAEALGLPVWQPSSLKTPESWEYLQQLAPDLIVTAAYGRILPPAWLELPRFGAVNVHASLLPRYRGAAPVQWSLINADQETGISFMQMDRVMDHGPVLSQHHLLIEPEDTAERLMKRLAELAAATLPTDLQLFFAGRLRPLPQDEQQASYVHLLKREDGLIDWHKTAGAIDCLVRGTNPWPGAYTVLNHKNLKIFQTAVVSKAEQAAYQALDQADQACPGTVVRADRQGLWVSCGQGTLLSLQELQLEGRRRLPAAEVAHNLKTGLCFNGQQPANRAQGTGASE